MSIAVDLPEHVPLRHANTCQSLFTYMWKYKDYKVQWCAKSYYHWHSSCCDACLGKFEFSNLSHIWALFPTLLPQGISLNCSSRCKAYLHSHVEWWDLSHQEGYRFWMLLAKGSAPCHPCWAQKPALQRLLRSLWETYICFTMYSQTLNFEL